MDLRDTPTEAAFRADLRAWLEENLPEGLQGHRGGATRFEGPEMRKWSRALCDAGYAGLIAANGGLEPTENSLFFKNHGFKVKLTISEDETWSELNEGKIAASVTTRTLWYVGTSMMNAWLMRRAVRSPVSLATTAPSSSSLCRLPFINSSASPCRTSSTALAAAP